MSTAADPVPFAAPFPEYRTLEDAQLSDRIEAVRQRMADGGADAEGLADALDLGGAF